MNLYPGFGALRLIHGRARRFLVYKITHVVSGKGYIGITTRSIPTRWKEQRHPGSRKRLTGIGGAIKKHGVEAFAIEHIASSTSVADLLALEAILIEQHGTLAPRGYNLVSHSDGVSIASDETRAKISARSKAMSAVSRAKIGAANRGKRHSPETLERMRISQTGKKRTAETVERVRAALLARGPVSAETRRKIAASNMGKVPTQEHRDKIAKAHKGRAASQETRAKMSISARSKPPVTDETRAKLSAACVGKPKSEAWRQKLIARQTGRALSPETKVKIAAGVARFAAAKNVDPRQRVLL